MTAGLVRSYCRRDIRFEVCGNKACPISCRGVGCLALSVSSLLGHWESHTGLHPPENPQYHHPLASLAK